MTKLTEFSEFIWTAYHPLRLAGMEMGARSTIIRLPSERLVIVSPVPFDDDTATAIDELGEVDTIIAPNLMHYQYFNDACRRWPTARALVPPGLEDKVDVVDRAVAMGHRGSIEDALYWRALDGMPRIGEHAFIEPRNGVLILTDVAFHYRDHPQWWLRLVMRINGTYNRFGPSRLLRAFAIDDKDALGRSLEALLDFDWDTIVVSHGEPIDNGARRRFLHAFGDYLPERREITDSTDSADSAPVRAR